MVWHQLNAANIFPRAFHFFLCILFTCTLRLLIWWLSGGFVVVVWYRLGWRVVAVVLSYTFEHYFNPEHGSTLKWLVPLHVST